MTHRDPASTVLVTMGEVYVELWLVTLCRVVLNMKLSLHHAVRVASDLVI